MPVPKPTDSVAEGWDVDFVGTCKIVTGKTMVTAEVSPLPASASGGHSMANGRRKLYIRNHVDSTFVGPTLFVGESNVTVADGYPVYANELLELDVTERVRVYAVTNDSEDPVDVRTLEVV